MTSDPMSGLAVVPMLAPEIETSSTLHSTVMFSFNFNVDVVCGTEMR